MISTNLILEYFFIYNTNVSAWNTNHTLHSSNTKLLTYDLKISNHFQINLILRQENMPFVAYIEV